MPDPAPRVLPVLATARPDTPLTPVTPRPTRPEFRLLAREVWWPPGRPKRRQQGALIHCARAEVGLARSGDAWVVLWKAPSMSAVAHTPYPCLRAAWASYRRHRDVLRALSSEAGPLDRLDELDRRILALTRERAALAALIEEGRA